MRSRLVKLLLVLLALCVILVGAVGATEISIFTNSTHESPVGNITLAEINGNIISVAWVNDPPLGENDQAGVISLYCPDTYGFAVWQGMAYGSGDQWDFTLGDIRRSNVNGCWFDLIDGSWMW